MNNAMLPRSKEILRIQRWALHGIAPMHRALIRRIASERLVGSQKIQWSVFESNDVLMTTSEFGFDIHWFSVDLLRAKSLSPDSQCIGGEICSRGGVSKVPLRLLWCWPPENYRDFQSTVPWMASGVVYNLHTLRGWVERALLQGHWSEHGASYPNPNLESNALVNPR